jgi:hypothetical protein
MRLGQFWKKRQLSNCRHSKVMLWVRQKVCMQENSVGQGVTKSKMMLLLLMLMILSIRRTLKSFHKQQSLFIIPPLKTLGVMAKVTNLSTNRVRGRVLKHPLRVRFQLLNCHGCHRKLKFLGRALQRARLLEKGGPSESFL